MAETTLFALIGGAPAVAALTDRFYRLMDELPEARLTRDLHPADLADSREKLTDYLTMWLGGPQTFIQKRGAPMLRARHLPFAIGTEAIDGWLACFRQALEETIAEPRIREAILPQIERLAHHMRNRDD